ncbi:MAG TPA: phosphotransferase [Anaeromyxobacteraceae bacterium]
MAEIDSLREAVRRLDPGARLVACEPLGADAGAGAAAVARKGGGYGVPLRLTLEAADGARRHLVFRTAAANEFGHDRRSDRAAELLLAFDTFGEVPDHVRALDVGAVAPDGLRSLRGADEFYLVTTWAEGRLYAEDLRALARHGAAGPLDHERAGALARWLAALHRPVLRDAVAWRRALRDLLGHGEGIFGVADAYPPDVPGAPAARLEALERRCLAWRWRLRGQEARLHPTHGDFHPFNLVFAEGTRFTALDASRGGRGDPADDVTALSVNYVFFALQAPGSWPRGFGPLWRRFWGDYLAASGDREVLGAAPPFLAWRALVLACPRFYPDLAPGPRQALLGLAERALDAGALDLEMPEALFR